MEEIRPLKCHIRKHLPVSVRKHLVRHFCSRWIQAIDVIVTDDNRALIGLRAVGMFTFSSLCVPVCWQIDNEEYGEALSLAQAYDLDSDLVYQRQWRKSTVSIASIQDYLVRTLKNHSVCHPWQRSELSAMIFDMERDATFHRIRNHTSRKCQVTNHSEATGNDIPTCVTALIG